MQNFIIVFLFQLIVKSLCLMVLWNFALVPTFDFKYINFQTSMGFYLLLWLIKFEFHVKD